jgi:hypothetical protein
MPIHEPGLWAAATGGIQAVRYGTSMAVLGSNGKSKVITNVVNATKAFHLLRLRRCCSPNSFRQAALRLTWSGPGLE